MQESSVYQDIIAKGIEQGIELGTKANAIGNILQVLEIRFQEAIEDLQRLQALQVPLKPNLEAIEDLQRLQALQVPLKPRLEAIEDLQRLKGLRRAAVEMPSLEAFLEKV